jgi:hypothetical protein
MIPDKLNGDLKWCKKGDHPAVFANAAICKKETSQPGEPDWLDYICLCLLEPSRLFA